MNEMKPNSAGSPAFVAVLPYADLGSGGSCRYFREDQRRCPSGAAIVLSLALLTGALVSIWTPSLAGEPGPRIDLSKDGCWLTKFYGLRGFETVSVPSCKGRRYGERCVCRRSRDWSKGEDEQFDREPTTTALKAGCNKVIMDVFGTLWLLGRAGAATADASFAEEMKQSVDGNVADSVDRWALKYHPSQQEVGEMFETLYDVAGLVSGVASAGKLGLSIARKAALRRAAAGASKQALSGSPGKIAGTGASKQMSNGPAAKGIGEAFIKDTANLNVDLAVQQHRHASKLKGTDLGIPLESAHLAPTSAVRNVPGYSRGGAETVLLPREHHRAFDRYWMKWARKRVKEGCKTTTVDEFLKIQAEALESVPALRGRTADTMNWKLFDEYYRQRGLKPDTKLRLPFSE